MSVPGTVTCARYSLPGLLGILGMLERVSTDISLIVTDLDGTLWDADERVHERTLAALTELAGRRLPLLVATGRRPRSAQASLARYGLVPPAVLLDGAMGVDLDGGRRFHESCFASADATSVLAAFASAGLSPALYVDRPGTDVVIGPRPSTHARHLDHIGEWLSRSDLDEVVATEPVYSFMVVDADPCRLAQVASSLGSAGTAVLTRDTYFHGTTITVRPPQTSKWEGVASYCAAEGLDRNRVLAVGDGENDLELLGNAAVSCVVRDGCDAALSLADHVIDPACDGGWATILGWC